VGTEHLLFTLVMDPGSRARRVLVDLNINIVAIKTELACYVQGSSRFNPGRSRRKRRNENSHAFLANSAKDSAQSPST